MTNTALSAEVLDTDKENMVFVNEKHKMFYFEKLKKARYQDCYHKSLLYILGISKDTREHFDKIYDIKSGCVKPECLTQGWQTSGSVRVVRLAFNLYTNGMPSVYGLEKHDEQLEECRKYSVSDIFCSSDALYFWEGIKLRYPEYCHEQESIEEILAKVKERKNVKNTSNGNEE